MSVKKTMGIQKTRWISKLLYGSLYILCLKFCIKLKKKKKAPNIGSSGVLYNL